MEVLCPECGTKQELEDAAGIAGRCRRCRATLTAAMPVFEAEPKPRKKKKKRPPPTQTQVADTEFRARASLGVNWLLAALLASILALGASLAYYLYAPAKAGDELSNQAFAALWAGRFAGFAAAACAFAAATAWRPLGRPLDHHLPTEWAWKLAVAMLTAAVPAAFLPDYWLLAELAWLGDWALYLLLVTMLQRICVRLGRGDLRDSADFVLQMGTGAVVFAAAAWLLALVSMSGLVGLRALAAMFGLFALLCLPLWAVTYGMLLLKVRVALN